MSRLFRNIAYNVMGQGLILILGFIGVKFIFSRLGADAFGIIYFNLILTGVLTTALELGVLVTPVRGAAAGGEVGQPEDDRSGHGDNDAPIPERHRPDHAAAGLVFEPVPGPPADG